MYLYDPGTICQAAKSRSSIPKFYRYDQFIPTSYVGRFIVRLSSPDYLDTFTIFSLFDDVVCLSLIARRLFIEITKMQYRSVTQVLRLFQELWRDLQRWR